MKSILDEKIKQLQLKKKQVEFLEHILLSAREYNHDDFKDVKDDVVSLLTEFVAANIARIEGHANAPATAQPTNTGAYSSAGDTPLQNPPQTPKDPSELPPNEKMNFALDNRHLSGKKVTVANDKNMTISGTVVGLDAPNVLVRTETGPVIKVPVSNISLI